MVEGEIVAAEPVAVWRGEPPPRFLGTIPLLLDNADALCHLDPREQAECRTEVAVDDTYGFPTRLRIDCCNTVDEETEIIVESFEALE